MVDHNDIIFFWNWFKTIESDLYHGLYDELVINKIDEFVQSVNDQLDWEIGPVSDSSEEGQKYFCISPCLNKGLLRLTSAVIKEAPDMPGWNFYSTKPRKGWIPLWEMYNEVGQKIKIDASNWEYVLYHFDDGSFDLDIKIDNIDGNQETKGLAIEICITNLLGEIMFMNKIQNIKIVDNFDTMFGQVNELRNLEKHLTQISNS